MASSSEGIFISNAKYLFFLIIIKMFNYSKTLSGKGSDAYQVFGQGKNDTYHKTVFCGPDPADPTRILLKKVVQISDSSYAF